MERLDIDIKHPEHELKCGIFQEANIELYKVAQTLKTIRIQTLDRMSAVCRDIISVSMLLDDLTVTYTQGAIDLLKNHKFNPKSRKTKKRISDQFRRDRILLVAVKAFFMFCRSYHDIIATLLLESQITKGRAAPQKASMESHILKYPSTDIYKGIVQRYRYFHQDFKNMRDRRNRIKEGSIMHGGLSIQNNVSRVTFTVSKTVLTGEHLESKVIDEISIEDLVQCINVSSHLVVATIKLIKKKITKLK